MIMSSKQSHMQAAYVLPVDDLKSVAILLQSLWHELMMCLNSICTLLPDRASLQAIQ